MTPYDPTVSVIGLGWRRRRRKKKEEEENEKRVKHRLSRYAHTTNFLNGGLILG